MSSFPKLVIAITLLLSSACTLSPYTIKYNKVGNSNYYYMPENGLYIRLLDFDFSNALMIIGKDSMSLANVKVTNDSPADLPDSINYFYHKDVMFRDGNHYVFAVDSLRNFFVIKEYNWSPEGIEHFPSFNHTRYEGLDAHYNFWSNFQYRSSDGKTCIKDGWVIFMIMPMSYLTSGYVISTLGNSDEPLKSMQLIGSDFEKKKRK